MTHSTKSLLVLFAIGSFAPAAQAQTQQTQPSTEFGYVTFSVGGQTTGHDLSTLTSPQIYGEPSSIRADHNIGGGALVDLGGGVRVWRKLSVGLTYSHFGDTGTAAITAQVPNPAFVGSYRTATTTANDAKRSEDALHFQAGWPFAIMPKLTVTGLIGPSFIHVSQDLVENIQLSEGAFPFSTVSISSVSLGSKSGWGSGVNVGADATYRIARAFDAGLLLRYAGATATLTAESGEEIKAKAGGFQIAVGVRYRF
jgi:opacity protein-like surface antigen